MHVTIFGCLVTISGIRACLRFQNVPGKKKKFHYFVLLHCEKKKINHLFVCFFVFLFLALSTLQFMSHRKTAFWSSVKVSQTFKVSINTVIIYSHFKLSVV